MLYLLKIGLSRQRTKHHKRSKGNSKPQRPKGETSEYSCYFFFNFFNVFQFTCKTSVLDVFDENNKLHVCMKKIEAKYIKMVQISWKERSFRYLTPAIHVESNRQTSLFANIVGCGYNVYSIKHIWFLLQPFAAFKSNIAQTTHKNIFPALSSSWTCLIACRCFSCCASRHLHDRNDV